MALLPSKKRKNTDGTELESPSQKRVKTADSSSANSPSKGRRTWRTLFGLKELWALSRQAPVSSRTGGGSSDFNPTLKVPPAAPPSRPLPDAQPKSSSGGLRASVANFPAAPLPSSFSSSKPKLFTPTPKQQPLSTTSHNRNPNSIVTGTQASTSALAGNLARVNLNGGGVGQENSPARTNAKGRIEEEDPKLHEARMSKKWERANAKAEGRVPPPASPLVRLGGSGYKKKLPMGGEKHKATVRDRDESHRLALAGQVKDKEGPRVNGSEDEAMDMTSYARLVEEARARDAFEPSPAILSRSLSRSSQDTTRQRDNTRPSGIDMDRLLKTAKATLNTPPPPSPPLEHFDLIKAALKEAEKAEKAPVKKIRKFPKRLSPADQQTVDETFRQTGVISTLPGAEVESKDLRRLQGSQWLNDEVITFYAIMINLRGKRIEEEGTVVEKEEFKKVFSFTSFFYAKYSASGYAGVERWTKKVDIFAKDIVIVPINLGNSHWVCAAINIKQKRFEYYDSFGHDNQVVYKRLRAYLAAEHLKKKKAELDLSDWVDYSDDDVPQQTNGSDCGIFTCQFMESLSRNVEGFDFKQRNMPYLRQKMVLEIKRKEIIPEPWGEEEEEE